jgi:hypothetical protein
VSVRVQAEAWRVKRVRQGQVTKPFGPADSTLNARERSIVVYLRHSKGLPIAHSSMLATVNGKSRSGFLKTTGLTAGVRDATR